MRHFWFGCISLCLLLALFAIAGCDAHTPLIHAVLKPTPTALAAVAPSTPPIEASSTPSVTPSQRATATPSLASTATPDALNTFQLIDAAVAHAEITIDDAALYKLYVLFGIGPPVVPERFMSQVPVQGDGTMLYLDAIKDWDKLQPETRAQIEQFTTPHQPAIAPTATKAANPTRIPTFKPRVPRPGFLSIEGVVTEILDATTFRMGTVEYRVLEVHETDTSSLTIDNKTAHVTDLKPHDHVIGLLKIKPDLPIEIYFLTVTKRATDTPTPTARATP